MSANKQILLSALLSIQQLSVLRKHLVIGQFSFSLFFSLVTIRSRYGNLTSNQDISGFKINSSK